MSILLNVADIKSALDIVGGRKVELDFQSGYASFKSRAPALEITFGIKGEKIGSAAGIGRGTFFSFALLAPLLARSGSVRLSVNNQRDLYLNRRRELLLGRPLSVLRPPKDGAQYRFDLEADHLRQALKYGLMIPRSEKQYEAAQLREGRIFFTDGQRVHVTSGFPNFLREGGFCWPWAAAEAASRALNVMPRYGMVDFLTWVKTPKRGPGLLFQSMTYVRGDYFVQVRSRSKYEEALDLEAILPQQPTAARVRVGLRVLRVALRTANGTPSAPSADLFGSKKSRTPTKEILVNPKFMLDALVPFRRTAVVELRDPRTPILVTGDVDNKFALVMPAEPEKGALR